MKKLLLSLVTLMSITAVSAQNFSWGIKAGATLSSIGGKAISSASKFDFTGGVFGEIQATQWLGVGAEVLYSGQGAKYSNSDTYLDLSYLNVPILANFHLSKVISLKTGIQPGFLLGQRERSGSDSEKVSIAKSFDLSVPVAIGVQLNCGLLFDLRYNIGLLNIANGFEGEKSYNSVFALTVGWRF